ncbi:MAG: COQ9 family protein [Pseudomonadota bacterium]
MTDGNVKAALLQAAEPHVPFDGWTEATFQAAQADAGISAGLAKAACPRGAVDLAVAFHEEGDAVMEKRLFDEDLSHLRYSEKVAAAVRFRIEAIEDKELVRRGATLFALPQYAGDGARLIWGTADRIWIALGDTSQDVNWYSKRAILSGVYGSTVLYWLGDETPGQEATWEFLDRRIAGVMQFEKLKARVRNAPLTTRLMDGPLSFLGNIRAPGSAPSDMPGRWSR